MKILLAADGSPYTRAAARHVRRNLGDWSGPHQIHVLHVQPPLPYAGRAKAVLGSAVVERMRAQEREVALEAARQELEGVDATVTYATIEGVVDERIEEYVAKHGIEFVVMGSHGLGLLAGALLGSVARNVIQRSKVPVLVIPQAAVEEPAAEAASPA
jgi:nucleotide-binding universal stress UspA family protein